MNNLTATLLLSATLSALAPSMADADDFSRSMHRVTRTGGAGNGVLWCPIVHDQMQAHWSSVWMNITDNSDDNVTCSLGARHMDGGSFFYSSETSYGKLAVKELSLKLVGLSGDYSLALTCSMPTNGSRGYTKLHSYRQKEMYWNDAVLLHEEHLDEKIYNAVNCIAAN